MKKYTEVKIGCCAPIDRYDEVAAAGFSYIELPGSVLAQLSPAELVQWERTIKDGPIPCRGLNASIPKEVKICGPMFSEEAAERYAHLLCTRAAQIGAVNIGIGSPMSRTLPQGFSVDTAWRQTEQFLRIFCTAAEPCGVQVLWEQVNTEETNFGTDSLESLEHVEKLVKEGLSNFGLIADIYHMARMGEDAATAAQVAPYVRHIHIAGTHNERGHITAADEVQMRPMLMACASKAQSISLEASHGSICTEGAAARVLLLRWLGERADT